VLTFEDIVTIMDPVAEEAWTSRTLQEEISMANQKPCRAVRLINPKGEVTFTQDFDTSAEAESRYARLVKACIKDQWLGARVQCLDASGGIVHELLISQ
jgi:hypothetical protein